MATYSKQYLSASTTGAPISVAATATLGTTIHTATSSGFDEIWLYAINRDTAPHLLTIEYGGAATSRNIIINLDAQKGLITIIPGLLLGNSLVLTAFADAANVINLAGYVNRIV